MAYRKSEKPTVTVEQGIGGRTETRTTHPAFATVRVNRVSGKANLFDSNISHDGYITMAFSEAIKFEDGYSESVMGGLGRTFFEVAMSENQFVAMVTRMNVGSGVPVTIQHRQTGPLEVVPAIEVFEDSSSRLRRMADEIPAKVREQMDERISQLKGMLVGLPKRKAEDIEKLLDLIVNQSKRNLDYGQKVITEHAEKKITEAKVEIDAHVSGVVSQLGLQSIRQLAQIAASVSVPDTKLLDSDS